MNKNHKKSDEYAAFAKVKKTTGKFACGYCKRAITDCSYEFDHVFADKNDERMLPACRTCNADKSDNSLLDYFLGDAEQARAITEMVTYTPTDDELEDARQFIIATHIAEIRERNRCISYNELRFFNIPENRQYAPIGAKLRVTQTEFDRYFRTYHRPEDYRVYVIKRKN